MIGFRVLLLFLLLFPSFVKAETPILERKVSLSFTDRRLPDALIELSRAANFYFSYNSTILNGDKKVSIASKNETVRAVLRRLVGEGFQFKEKGNFLIIQKLKTNERLIGGYISDKKTGQGVADATIYDKKTLKSTTTDSFGYYEIVSRQPIQELSVAKFDYTDTIFQVKSLENTPPQYLDVSLLPTQTTAPKKSSIKISIDVETGQAIAKKVRDATTRFTERTLLENFDLQNFVEHYSNGFRRVDALNVKSALRRQFQWSLTPYVGNNGGLSGAIENDIALNLTVGYSKGTRILEVAGVGNINRGNMTGIQLASTFNIVGGRMSGIQVTSLLNRSSVLSGTQVSGLTNSTDSILRDALQIAALNNHASKGCGGIQISSVVNKTARGQTGSQVSALVNVADTVKCQIGLINRAQHLRGLQIGLINVSDSVSGVVLGLLNVVKKGYNTVEFALFDGQFTRFAYKTGTKSFYTNYVAAVKTDKSTTLNSVFSPTTSVWSLGMGVGGGVHLTRSLRLTTDITAESMNIGQITEGVFRSRLFRVAPALDLKISTHIAFALGGHWSAYTADKTRLGIVAVDDFQKKIVPLSAKTLGDYWTWWGWSVGIRFF
ncbi:MAG: STN and carboxypeptidase regulatory-like domain-containing protein [Saprospiraceae bacterium]|nr:STN and carboxypeptidase regulatory-like domain-containing protein [Saprospiraceae bacterium]